jgi:hypothetical protein
LATLKKSVEIKIKFLISKLYFLVYIAEFFFWIYLYFAAIKYGLIVEEEFVLWRDRAPVIWLVYQTSTFFFTFAYFVLKFMNKNFSWYLKSLWNIDKFFVFVLNNFRLGAVIVFFGLEFFFWRYTELFSNIAIVFGILSLIVGNFIGPLVKIVCEPINYIIKYTIDLEVPILSGILSAFYETFWLFFGLIFDMAFNSSLLNPCDSLIPIPDVITKGAESQEQTKILYEEFLRWQKANFLPKVEEGEETYVDIENLTKPITEEAFSSSIELKFISDLPEDNGLRPDLEVFDNCPAGKFSGCSTPDGIKESFELPGTTISEPRNFIESFPCPEYSEWDSPFRGCFKLFTNNVIDLDFSFILSNFNSNIFESFGTVLLLLF